MSQSRIYSVFEIAGYICNHSGWTCTNLELQKLVYIAQMSHIGESKGRPLFKEDFQAWSYGPVCPDLYHKLKMFGIRHVQPYSGLPQPHCAFDDLQQEVLDYVCQLGNTSEPWELVEITHHIDSAWAKKWDKDKKHIWISKQDIWDEYKSLG